MNLTITDPDALDEVSGEIHDWFFDIEDVDFDPAHGVLSVPFRRWSYEEARTVSEDPPATGWRKLFGSSSGKSWEAPWYRWILRIHNADSYHLHDGAEIGCADFLHVSYDHASRVVTVEGNIPVTIKASVHALAVQVEQTDELLGIARYRTYGNGDSYTGEVFPLPEHGW
jgi:hypothetical protein